MEPGLVLFIFFGGWFALHMLTSWWVDGDDSKNGIAVFVNVAWIIGGTLWVLSMAGIF